MMYYKSMKKNLLACAFTAVAAFSAASPAAQAYNRFQTRATMCSSWYDGKRVNVQPCIADFAGDGAIRRITVTESDGTLTTVRLGYLDTTFGKSAECLISRGAGHITALCTVKTPEQLGIMGD